MYETYFRKLVTKVKPNINSVEVHPQLSNNGHPVDGAMVGAGSVWSPVQTSILTIIESVDRLARYLRGEEWLRLLKITLACAKQF
jgi:hypothetical protein